MVKEEKLLFGILLFFAVISLISLMNYKMIWWDEAVYIGIGKYLYSGGTIGLFEEIRPVVLPIFLGFFWLLGLDPLFFGRLLVFFSSLINIYLIYLIGRRIFSLKVGFIASFFLAFTLLYYNYSYLSLTGIFSTTFALVSIYFFIQKRNYKNILLSSFFLGIAFLTRFPQGAILICFLIFLLYKREFRNIMLLLTTFLLVISPFLIFNYLQYGSAFTPFIRAQEVVTGYKWLYDQSPIFYFKELLFQNYLFIFIIPFFYFFYKDRKGALIVLILLFFTIFFSTHVHKELRYSLIFLPYLCLLASKGFYSSISSFKLDNKLKNIVLLSLFFILIIYFSTNLYFASGSYSEEEINFYSNFSDGEVVYTTTPLITYFSNAKVVPVYMNLDDFEIFLNRDHPSRIFFSDTFPCNTQECENKKINIINQMKENYNYHKEGELYYFYKDK
jgi:4-amino-4-deoxy-L-arabinose transferase-like glycosyltransferase